MLMDRDPPPVGMRRRILPCWRVSLFSGSESRPVAEQVQPAPAVRAGAERQPRTWCRIQFHVSLVPPATGKIVSIERGPRTVRVTLCCPKALAIAGAVAFVTSHPFTAQVFFWVLKVLGF